MTIYKHLNYISQENLYIKSLFTKIGVYVRLAVKHPLASVNSGLIYEFP